MDKKVLEALGAPKEGHEWRELPVKDSLASDVTVDDFVIAASGEVWSAGFGNINHCRGIALGSGKFYRQVPIEPPVDVIWGPRLDYSAEYRITADGILQVNHGDGDGWHSTERTGHAGVSIAEDYAALYAKNQANEARADKAEAKLREIKEKARAMLSGTACALVDDGYDGPAHLVLLCREIEVPSDTAEVKA